VHAQNVRPCRIRTAINKATKGWRMIAQRSQSSISISISRKNFTSSTIGSKSNRDAFRPAHRRIQQHLDSNSGFQFDVIIGATSSLLSPTAPSPPPRRRPLFRQTQPRRDPPNRVLGGPNIGLRKSPAVRSPEIRSTQRPRLFSSRTSAWTTMIVGFCGLGPTQESGAAFA
jgi:hypothetical protein